MQAGVPALDYYFIGLFEEEAWRRVLGLSPARRAAAQPSGNLSDIYHEMVAEGSDYDAVAAKVRRAFRAVPESSHVLRGYTKVVALATHVKEISQRRALWVFRDDSVARLREVWWRGGAPTGGGISLDCPVLPLLAALVVASALSAPIVEIVCGLRTNPADVEQGDGGGRKYMWADVLPLDGKPAPAERDSDRPRTVLVENLFRLATYILTKLPPTEPIDGQHHPAVTMALEIEPGSSNILNSPDEYVEIRKQYDNLVRTRVDELMEDSSATELIQQFRVFADVRKPTGGDWDQLRRLYRLCIGLNVDVGHMLLLDQEPCDLTGFAWYDGVHWFDGRQRKWRAVHARDLPTLSEMRRGKRRDLCGEIVHYHLSDHRGAHYCDLPPGRHHAAIEFEGWIRQAYALAQMSGWSSTGGIEPRVHPNLSRYMAIELEASVLGYDRVVSSCAQVSRWIRHCVSSGKPIEVIA